MKPPKQEVIEKLFIFMGIFLPLQYIWIGTAGVLLREPWPTFALPGFKTIYASENQMELLNPVFLVQFGDKGEEEVSAANLFEGIPASQLQGFIRTNFKEQRSFDKEAINWFEERLRLLYPSDVAIGLTMIWNQETYNQTSNRVALVSVEPVKTIDIYSSEE